MFSEKITGSYNILSLEKNFFGSVGLFSAYIHGGNQIYLIKRCFAFTFLYRLLLWFYHSRIFLNSAYLAGFLHGWALLDFHSCCALWSNILSPSLRWQHPQLPTSCTASSSSGVGAGRLTSGCRRRWMLRSTPGQSIKNIKLKPGHGKSLLTHEGNRKHALLYGQCMFGKLSGWGPFIWGLKAREF